MTNDETMAFNALVRSHQNLRDALRLVRESYRLRGARMVVLAGYDTELEKAEAAVSKACAVVEESRKFHATEEDIAEKALEDAVMAEFRDDT